MGMGVAHSWRPCILSFILSPPDKGSHPLKEKSAPAIALAIRRPMAAAAPQYLRVEL
jgi:hypothetical protein